MEHTVPTVRVSPTHSLWGTRRLSTLAKHPDEGDQGWWAGQNNAIFDGTNFKPRKLLACTPFGS